MNLAALLADLRQRGIELTVDGDQLHYRAPKGVLTSTLREALIEQKTAILAALKAQQVPPAPPVCLCGNTTGIWEVNEGTCWAQWVCRGCQGQLTLPTAHQCDPSLPLTAPCCGTNTVPWWQEGLPIWTCGGCGRSVPCTEQDEDGNQHFVCPTCESFAVMPPEPGKSCTSPPLEQPYEPPAKVRPFLPRPLGQEDAADPWTVWVSLFDWLIEHRPDRFAGICEAEEALRALERAGVSEGSEYEAACAELLWRFEEARRLRLSGAIKVWLQ
jgi:hypothetical protein